MADKIALIFGITGQDGYYLSKLLTDKNYKVFGTFHEKNPAKEFKLINLGVNLIFCNINNEESVVAILSQIKPEEIYNLAGQSSVRDSWDNPSSYIQTNSIGVSNILNALVNPKLNLNQTRFFQASSSEMFGETTDSPANERHLISPNSPYGASKALGHNLVGIYRKSHGCYAISGILFNHESPLRDSTYLSKKISSGVVKIFRGEAEEIMLGNLDVSRDWSFAGDVMNAAWLTMQQKYPDDYVIASGESKTVAQFVEEAFLYLGIQNWRRYIRIADKLVRKNEARIVKADPAKIFEQLKWKPEYTFEQLVHYLVENELTK
jgi:GDPmannose 4,6-dehydratase